MNWSKVREESTLITCILRYCQTLNIPYRLITGNKILLKDNQIIIMSKINYDEKTSEIVVYRKGKKLDFGNWNSVIDIMLFVQDYNSVYHSLN